MNIDEIDLTELRRMWRRREARSADVRARTDPRGMTRPARDPDERAFLRSIGGEGPFTEVEMPGLDAWRAARSRAGGAAAAPGVEPESA